MSLDSTPTTPTTPNPTAPRHPSQPPKSPYATLYRAFKVLDSLYLLLLGVGVGCIVACGAFAAPVVFRASSFLPELSLSDSGLLMGQIFLKCNIYFNVLAGVILVYELATFATAPLFTHTRQRRLWLLLGGISAMMIFLFTLYYTPYIMEAQRLNATATPEFSSMHKQSELVFKILLFTLAGSALWRGIVGSKGRF